MTQEDDPLVRAEQDAAAPFVSPETQLPPSVPVTTKPVPRPEPPKEMNVGSSTAKPMPLPEGKSGRYEEPRRYYYEGDSCSGSGGGYYDDDYGSGDTIYVGGDDDDDDDSAPPPATGDDDDDDDDDDVDIEWGDDDDDDDDDELQKLKQRRSIDRELVSPVQTQKLGVRGPVERRQSPLSRVALLGVLIVFPLRRRFRSL